MAVNKKEAAAGLASAVALLSGAQVANAADVEVGPVVGHDWSGLYLGFSAGTQWGDAPFLNGEDYEMGGDIAFGAFVGVNHQYDNFVVGAELAVQTGNETDGDDDTDYEVKWTADAKLKLGMVLGAEDQLLVYGFGGFFATESHIEYPDEDYSTVGVNFGVGAEYMVTEQFSLGAEFIVRAPIDDYGWTDSGTSDSSYQASLRAAFHF